jgi:hypothetical protein
MQPRLLAFAAAFRSSAPVYRSVRLATDIRIQGFICRNCQRKFSTSPTLRWFGKSAKSAKPVERERSTYYFPLGFNANHRMALVNPECQSTSQDYLSTMRVMREPHGFPFGKQWPYCSSEVHSFSEYLRFGTTRINLMNEYGRCRPLRVRKLILPSVRIMT